jgi:hypothetical protein
MSQMRVKGFRVVLPCYVDFMSSREDVEMKFVFLPVLLLMSNIRLSS